MTIEAKDGESIRVELNLGVDQTVAVSVLYGVVVSSVDCSLTVSRRTEKQFKRIEGEVLLKTESVPNIAHIGFLATGIEFYKKDLIGLHGSRSGYAFFEIEVCINLAVYVGIWDPGSSD